MYVIFFAQLNISFNEEAITTFEYPSEASILGEDDTDGNDKENPLGHKTPNILNSGSKAIFTDS